MAYYMTCPYCNTKIQLLDYRNNESDDYVIFCNSCCKEFEATYADGELKAKRKLIDDRASDDERFYQCLTCKYIDTCNLNDDAEDERGMCKSYIPDVYVGMVIAERARMMKRRK